MSRNFFANIDELFAQIHDRLEVKPGQTEHPGLQAAWSDLAELDRRMAELKEDSPVDSAETAEPSPQPADKPTVRPLTPAEQTMLQLARDYRNLNLEPGVGLEEVKAAYKAKIKQYHPDQNNSEDAASGSAHQKTVELNDSYQRLLTFLEQRGF